LKPGQPMPAFDEIQFMKAWKPDVDWDGIMAQRATNEAEARNG
jgi:hypothetical protein